MNKIKSTLYIGAMALALTSCNEFLSDAPSKSSSLVPSELDHMEFILNNYNDFYDEPNLPAMLGSDAYGLVSDLTAEKAGTPGLYVAQYATWDFEGRANYNREAFFSGEYSKIFRANMVLEYLKKMSGSDERKAQLEREAKFIRAYSMFNLAETYCLPYTEANKGELGMTLKRSTSFEESAQRSTLEATHKYIEENLEAALGITNDMTIVNNKYTSWRANKAAVNGFAARYWLQRGQYDKALGYAETALSSHDVLMDYNTDMRYSENPSYATVNGEKVEILYPYTHDNQMDMTDMMEWKESMYYRMAYFGSWWFCPSADLLSKYDQEYDLRFKYHIVDNYSHDRGLTQVYPGYIFFFKDKIPSGPTTAECLLIKAECLARTGNVSEAMATVNKLRVTRMDKNAPDEAKYLKADTKEEALQQILDERYREMPFTMRWFDVRRLNHNEDPNDNVGDITRTYFPYNSATVLDKEALKTYTLKPGDRAYAAPIPQKEIDASTGAIEQNKY